MSIAAAIAFEAWAEGEGHEMTFVERSVTVSGVRHRFQVALPRDWSPDREWPVVLFLHGAGERGTNTRAAVQVGLGPQLKRRPREFVAVFPQCRPEAWWTDARMQSVALAALDAATTEFHGDRRRTTLAGLSMGGYGAIGLAAAHPERFAAVVAICGGVLPPWLRGRPILEGEADPYAAAAAALGKTPVWLFHGAADNVIPVEESRKLHQALEAAGGDVRYTEYAGVDHNSWDRAFGEEPLYDWLGSHSIGPR